MDNRQCDILVLGSGEAGKYLAWTLAKAGQHAVVIERELVGGACPNVACLPSKNVIHAGHVAALARRGAEFGVHTDDIRIDMTAVRERKRRMVADLVEVHRRNYQASGAELVMGEGRFVAPRTIELRVREGGARRYTAERVFLNLGTRAALPPVEGLSEAQPLTQVEALELGIVPEHLLVLGGGYVGLEFAQPMRRFGARVTVLEQGPQIAGREDPEVAQGLLERLQAEGICFRMGGQVGRVEGRSGERVRLHVAGGDGPAVVEGSHLLVAAGRTPNTGGIGLEDAGIELDERGFVKVNERLETTAAGVWAMGDCAGSPQFTHVSYDDFRIVRDNLQGGDRSTRGRLVPYCMFTDPELGRVGLNESQARQAGLRYRVARLPMTAVLRTRTVSEPHGFLKALVAADSDQLLGFTALGYGAGELIAVVQVAMQAGLPYTALRDSVLTHPTMAEGLTVLFAEPPVAADPQSRQ